MADAKRLSWATLGPTPLPDEQAGPDTWRAMLAESAPLRDLLDQAAASDQAVLLVVNDSHRATQTRPALTSLGEVIGRRACPARFRALVATGTHRFTDDERRAFEAATFSGCGLNIEQVAWHDADDAAALTDVGAVGVHDWLAAGRFIVAIGMTENRQLPDDDRPPGHNPLPQWLGKHGYRMTENLVTTTDGTFRMYAKACGVSGAYVGPNEGGLDDHMYIVIVEPMWWFAGEHVADLVFIAPDTYVGEDVNQNDIWEDENGDQVWTGGVPAYVDVVLRVPEGDPTELESLTTDMTEGGKRKFAQRIYLPGGGE